MHAYNRTYISRLKDLIILHFNGTEIHSSDCYLLSVEIQQRVNRRVSETTLKRFFGFTSCSHNPSQYTLNALAVFCEFTSWNHFKEEEDRTVAANSENRQWIEVRTRLLEITEFHLNALKRRHQGRLGKTIRRSWIDSSISRFEKSNKNILMFHGPAGFGKTLAISTWIEEQVGRTGTNENIYLYIDSLSFFQSAVYGYDPIKWLANVFDFDNADLMIRFFQQYQQNAPGYIHILIDGFNEEIVAENQYYAVLTNLLDMIDHFRSTDWLNFTLILRSDIYEKVSKKLPITYRELWWGERDSDGEQSSFSEQLKYSTIEISALFNHHQIDHNIQEIALSSNYNWLQMPLYLDSFLRLREMHPNLNFRYDELKFLLIRDVIEKDLTLLNALENAEQQEVSQLIRTIPCIDNITPDRGTLNNRKKRMLLRSALAIKLIGSGILIKNPEGVFTNGYQFASSQFKAFLYTFYQYHTVGIRDYRTFSECIVSDIPETSKATSRLCYIWFMCFQLEDLDFSFIELISHNVNPLFPPNDELLCIAVTFINHLYHSTGKRDKQELTDRMIRSDIGKKLVHRTSLPYTRLKQILHLLLEMEAGPDQEFRLRFKMALLAFLKWDESEFIIQLEHLATLQNKINGQLCLDPVAGLSILYHFFKYGKVNPEDVRIVFNKNFQSEYASIIESDYSCEIVGYLMLLIAPDPKLAADYLLVIRSKMDRLTNTEGVAYTIYDLLCQLLAQMTYRDSITSAGGYNRKYSMIFNDASSDSLLGFYTQILKLHLDIVTVRDDDNLQGIRNRTRILHTALEPLGYTVLSKYFATIAYTKGKHYDFRQNLSEKVKDQAKKWIQ